MQPTDRWTPFRPHPIQTELWKTKSRFVAVPAGRGSGKTELAKRRLVRYLAVKKPWSDPKYFYGAPTQDQAMRIAWEDFKALIPEDWLAKEPKGNKIVTKFGSELWVVGLDRPQRIEGNQWDGCVLDESCDLKPGTFDLSIVPTLTHRDGWCWRIGVPKRQGPSCTEYRKFFESAVTGEIPNAAGYTWPSSDILSTEQLAYAQSVMDARDYNEQFNAQWETVGGGIFHSFSKKHNVRPCLYDRTRPIIVGSDFNVDPMAWVLGHVYDGVRVEWFDEIWIKNTNTQETLDALYGRYQHHKGGFEFYGDASSASRKTSAAETDYIQILNDKRFQEMGRGIHYPQSNPSVDDRFAACNALLLNAAGIRRMHVDPKCRHLIDDLEDRHYKSGTRDAKDTGDLGHITDAMGYVVQWMFPIPVQFDPIRAPVIITSGT